MIKPVNPVSPILLSDQFRIEKYLGMHKAFYHNQIEINKSDIRMLVHRLTIETLSSLAGSTSFGVRAICNRYLGFK